MSGEGALLSNAGAVFPVAATDTGAGHVAPARSGDLMALADRCEQATGRDRTLEQDIHDAIYGRDYLENPHQTDGSRIRTYTTSLDAAMTLVPEGWHISFLHQDRYTQAPMLALARNGDNSGKIAPCEAAPTVTLAFCAAALRALASDGS